MANVDRVSSVCLGAVEKGRTQGKAEESLIFVAKQADCQTCPRKANCLPAKDKRKHVSVRCYPLFEEASESQ